MDTVYLPEVGWRNVGICLTLLGFLQPALSRKLSSACLSVHTWHRRAWSQPETCQCGLHSLSSVTRCLDAFCIPRREDTVRRPVFFSLAFLSGTGSYSREGGIVFPGSEKILSFRVTVLQ